MSGHLLSQRFTELTQRLSCLVLSRAYAKAPPAGGKAKGKGGKLGAAVEKVKLPAETDTKKLVNFVCGSNIYVDGKDVEIKPESEYPEWLFNLHVGKPKPIEELDPNTKEYWRRLRRAALRRNNQLAKLRRF